MRSIALAVAGALIFAAGALLAARTGRAAGSQAQPGKSSQLTRPLDYRQWVYLSSGLGMEYSASSYGPQLFTNVFVAPAAYRQFVATGKWPEGTTFVLEEREGLNKGSINKAGHYQGELAGVAASVKDASRFPGGWAYFKFANGASSATPMPRAACWECHNAHGAVDNTFVQFYPTLKPVARKFGAYDERKAAAP